MCATPPLFAHDGHEPPRDVGSWPLACAVMAVHRSSPQLGVRLVGCRYRLSPLWRYEENSYLTASNAADHASVTAPCTVGFLAS